MGGKGEGARTGVQERRQLSFLEAIHEVLLLRAGVAEKLSSVPGQE
jgi:hypothetical protein